MKSIFKKIFYVITLLFIGLTLSGCISNLLKEKIPAFSDEINFTAPVSPFEKIKSASYPSWKNSVTQNVILMTSNCDNTQYTTNQSYQTITESLEDTKVEILKITNLKMAKYNAKKITGNIDNDIVEVRTLSFEHHHCVFLSALSGKPQSIDKDFDNWKSFLNSIELKK
jgi:hypothetical protein